MIGLPLSSSEPGFVYDQVFCSKSNLFDSQNQLLSFSDAFVLDETELHSHPRTLCRYVDVDNTDEVLSRKLAPVVSSLTVHPTMVIPFISPTRSLSISLSLALSSSLISLRQKSFCYFISILINLSISRFRSLFYLLFTLMFFFSLHIIILFITTSKIF